MPHMTEFILCEKNYTYRRTCKYVLLSWSAWFWSSWLDLFAAASDNLATISVTLCSMSRSSDGKRGGGWKLFVSLHSLHAFLVTKALALRRRKLLPTWDIFPLCEVRGRGVAIDVGKTC